MALPPFPVKPNDPNDPNSHLIIDPETQRPIHHKYQYIRPINHLSKQKKDGQSESDFDQEQAIQQRYRGMIKNYYEKKNQDDKIAAVVSKDPNVKVQWDQNDLRIKRKELWVGRDCHDTFNGAYGKFAIRRRRQQSKRRTVPECMSGEDYANILYEEQSEWKRPSLYFPEDGHGEKWINYYDLCQRYPVKLFCFHHFLFFYYSLPFCIHSMRHIHHGKRYLNRNGKSLRIINIFYF